MKKYRKHDSPRLLSEFNKSGQTQAQFSKAHNIQPNYFNQQLNKHLKRDKPKFVAVEPPKADIEKEGLVITVGRCSIQCPSSMPLPSLSALVQSLA